MKTLVKLKERALFLKIPQQTFAFLSSLLMAVVLLVLILAGMRNGQATAQAEMIAHSALSLKQGLQYFYDDQERFPSADEFGNHTLMLNYFNLFPPMEFYSGGCVQNFDYKRISPTAYQLNFCLPKAAGNFSAGWNQINQSSDTGNNP